MKRKRIIRAKESDSEESSESESDDKTKGKTKGRKNIKKIFTVGDLEKETLEAAEAEKERKKRIAERQKLVKHSGSSPPNECDS